MHEVRRYAAFALIPAVIIGALVFAYERSHPKEYQATVTLFVQSQTNSQSQATTSASESTLLTPSYSQMITDPVVTQAVNKLVGLKYPGYIIADHALTTQQNPGALTSLVSLSVTDTIPARAMFAANAVARTFESKLSIMASRTFAPVISAINRQIGSDKAAIQLDNSLLRSNKTALTAAINARTQDISNLFGEVSSVHSAEAGLIGSVQIYSPAVLPTSPVAPHPTSSGLLAFFAVLLLGIGGVRAYDFLNDALRKPQDVEEIAQAPILGTVHKFKVSSRDTALIAAREPRSAAAESYRLIRTNLRFVDVDADVRTVVITSANPGEGKSTTISNLARVFAEAGSTTAVVDADLRRPMLHKIFGIQSAGGLTSILVASELNGHVVSTADEPNLTVIASGPLPPNPGDLVGSQRMSGLLKQLRERCDFVLLDSPPVLSVADAAVLATMTDGVVLVVDLEKTKRRDLQRACDAINVVGGRILGVIVNRVEHKSGYYYEYYGYDSTYGTHMKLGAKNDDAEVESPRQEAVAK